MVAEAPGAKGRLFTKTGSGVPDWQTGTIERFAFYREDMRKIGKIVHPQVITGDRSEHHERARKAPNLYYGTITLPVSSADMAVWAPRFLGGSPSGTSYPIATTLPAFAMLIDKVTTTYEFQSCYVDQCYVQGVQNGPNGGPNFLTMKLTIFAMGYQKGVSAPSTTLAVTGGYVPYVIEDSVLTLQSASREFKQIGILHHNFVKQRYVNSLDPTVTYPTHRLVVLQTRHPFDTGTSGLDDVALASSAAGTLALTNSTVSLTWNFGMLNLNASSPIITGYDEIDLPGYYVSRMTGSTDELSLTIDSTP